MATRYLNVRQFKSLCSVGIAVSIVYKLCRQQRFCRHKSNEFSDRNILVGQRWSNSFNFQFFFFQVRWKTISQALKKCFNLTSDANSLLLLCIFWFILTSNSRFLFSYFHLSNSFWHKFDVFLSSYFPTSERRVWGPAYLIPCMPKNVTRVLWVIVYMLDFDHFWCEQLERYGVIHFQWNLSSVFCPKTNPIY